MRSITTFHDGIQSSACSEMWTPCWQNIVYHRGIIPCTKQQESSSSHRRCVSCPQSKSPNNIASFQMYTYSTHVLSIWENPHLFDYWLEFRRLQGKTSSTTSLWRMTTLLVHHKYNRVCFATSCWMIHKAVALTTNVSIHMPHNKHDVIFVVGINI